MLEISCRYGLYGIYYLTLTCKVSFGYELWWLSSFKCGSWVKLDGLLVAGSGLELLRSELKRGIIQICNSASSISSIFSFSVLFLFCYWTLHLLFDTKYLFLGIVLCKYKTKQRQPFILKIFSVSGRYSRYISIKGFGEFFGLYKSHKHHHRQSLPTLLGHQKQTSEILKRSCGIRKLSWG